MEKLSYQETLATLNGYLSAVDRALGKAIGMENEAIVVPQLVTAGVATLSLMADFDMLKEV